MYQNEYQTKGYALVAAAAKGDTGRVWAALDGGADIHFESDLALRGAALTGNLDTLKLLIAKGANIHANNEEALLYAAKRQDHEMARYLIGKGASMTIMMRHHAALVDDDCLCTFDDIRSGMLRDAFEKNFLVMQEKKRKLPRQGNKFRL